MPKTIQTTIYEYDELPTDKAKENARQWFYSEVFDHDWWDSIHEGAKEIGLKITSFDLDSNRHAKGEFITSAPECAESVIKQHGETCETYKTAKDYLEDRQGERPSDSDENADDSEWEQKTEEEDSEFLKAILECYSIILQNEYEYMGSTEYLEDVIRANEYTFDEDGARFG